MSCRSDSEDKGFLFDEKDEIEEKVQEKMARRGGGRWSWMKNVQIATKTGEHSDEKKKPLITLKSSFTVLQSMAKLWIIIDT